MLNPAVIRQVERLLAQGRLSQRKIARTLRVSRGTVAAVAKGTRTCELRRQQRQLDFMPEPLAGPMVRCGGCGGVVRLPCRLCRVRRLLRQGKVKPVPGPRLDDCRTELTGEERRRYLQVRAARIRAERLGEPVVLEAG